MEKSISSEDFINYLLVALSEYTNIYIHVEQHLKTKYLCQTDGHGLNMTK